MAVTGNATTPQPNAPAATLNPTTVDLTAAVGSAASRSMTVTNSGAGTLDLGTAIVTGDPSRSIGSDSCAGRHLAVNGSCTIVVQFHPTAVSTVGGQLKVTDDAPTSQQTVTLTGHGH